MIIQDKCNPGNGCKDYEEALSFANADSDAHAKKVTKQDVPMAAPCATAQQCGLISSSQTPARQAARKPPKPPRPRGQCGMCRRSTAPPPHHIYTLPPPKPRPRRCGGNTAKCHHDTIVSRVMTYCTSTTTPTLRGPYAFVLYSSAFPRGNHMSRCSSSRYVALY